MEILHKHSEYLNERDLYVLMVKIANSSVYNNALVDQGYCVSNTDEQNKAYDKLLRDKCLAHAILAHIFLNTHAYESMPKLFKKLSFGQQANFRKYYDSFRDSALANGCLVDYDVVRAKISSFTEKNALVFLLIFCLSMAFNLSKSLKVVIAVGIVFAVLDIFTQRSDAISQTMKKQNDFVIKKANCECIESVKHWAKSELIKAGLLVK